MGAWGIKALERDEGLDVLDILKNEYVPEHPVMDLGEMIELMKEKVMLGSDFSQIDFLFDNTAMALAELYFQWKDNGKLDYDHEEAIWDKVTGFTASKEALAFLLRQLTDIKNEVPDEDGIREIVDLWKNEDSGEIAPAWLEHLNQLIERLASEQEARQMYIKKYWGNFIGGSDDSLNLVAFLEDQKKEEIPLSEIFAKIGLDKQNWDFRQTVEYLEFTHSDGVEMDFHFAIDVVTDLAAILLECSVSGSVNLHDLDEYNTPSRRIRITATPEEHEAMDKAMADFVHAPLEYDLSEMMGEDEITDMAYQVEMLRKELYEASGRNRNYHVKAEDVKHLLPDWEGADGCIATNRITVEGCKVVYCYREEPDGGWDSGWRFTAGDESEAYMDDPNNAGIYKLNTICNDDPDIIPLLHTLAPCAFERDENGMFQQINDWKPDEDDEDQTPELNETLTDMDYIPYTPENAEEFFAQLEQWNDEDEYTRCIQALNAIPEDWRNYRTAYALARALENYAIIGDHDEGTLKSKGDKALLRAIEVLESVREEGQDKAEWNMRMAYGYQYLYGQEEKAIPYAQRWAELDPEDENAPAVIQECKAEIRKRQRSRKKKAKFVPGDTPFEGFDLTNFWDDNWYALKEYVSDPPSDELIASVEEELGYKLPAAYIWLIKQHNGGIPVNTCYPCDEPTCWAEDHVAITGIFGIGREKSCSLCGELGSQFMIDEWEYPAIGVAICDCPSAGHDMIFLDYRACGPQGEPAVVHVDQENDYKITHLADSFEEFIRGLEHESLYDPDEDVEDLEDESCDHSDNEEEFSNPEVYTEEEMEAVEGHIEQYFGEVENVFHELVSPDIHVDICIVPPSEERDYYTLITMGMGAHRMNVPKELAEYKLERAELAIALPADWKLDQESIKDERWYWPIRLLKSLARLPINCDSWLGHGHTVENREPFADNTKLCTATLIGPQDTEDGSEICTLPGGEEVNFYQVIPLYADELDYKLEHDADALLNKMRGISFVVNPTRQDAITRGTLSNDDFDGEMDDASYHLESIEEKELPIDPINAYNHMVIYLRWCMEHDLMGEDFLKEYSEVAKQVKADPTSVDLRAFIRDELDGSLFSVLFNQQGRAFAGYYYGEGDSPYYPADVDDNALRFFGPERYHSDEFQDEAYLFIPFDEEYYQAMAKVIEECFVNWQGQDFDEDTLEPSDVAQAIMEYLDCECTYFPSMKDDDPIMSAYSYAKRLGVREGFVPVLIQADDETLLECLVMNADPENDADFYEFDLKTVTEYRKKMLSAPVKDGKAVLEALTGQRKEEAEDDDMDWDEVLGEMEGGETNDRFSSYWDDDTEMTYPLILAKIPVKNPWEIFAYLPFGNWNDCPDTPELMAAAKYWFEQYGAVPAAMSHDELEFLLPAPVPKEKAMDVAVELYGFCPDLDQNEDGSIGSLADALWQSTVWYFWWD